jgi:hypothetical protein
MSRFITPPTATVPVSMALAGVLAAFCVSITGCSLQPSFSVKITTADDVTMEVPLSRNTDINTGDDAVDVKVFRFVPLSKDTMRALGYYFALKFKNGAQPTSVVIDDVSEAPIENIVADKAPKVEPDGKWAGASRAFEAEDPHVSWVDTLDNGIRVFRITAVLKDGTTHVLRLPIPMPAGTKAVFRAELGIK